MILTVDLGTTVTKVALWSDHGVVARSGSTVHTLHPDPGRAEQDPATWWTSVKDASAQVRRQAPNSYRSVEVIGCTGPRESFATLDSTGTPIGPGMLWSDRRAAFEATRLAQDAEVKVGIDPRTGSPLDAGSMAAKLAWLAAHERERFERCTWILSPRDLVVWRLTGAVATDPSMASRTGLYDLAGDLVEALAGAVAEKLAPVVPSDEACGQLTTEAGSALGLRAGTPVVIGAGDPRARCSVPVRARPCRW